MDLSIFYGFDISSWFSCRFRHMAIFEVNIVLFFFLYITGFEIDCNIGGFKINIKTFNKNKTLISCHASDNIKTLMFVRNRKNVIVLLLVLLSNHKLLSIIIYGKKRIVKPTTILVQPSFTKHYFTLLY